MKDKICILIQLQHCDNRIREIRKRKDEGPKKIKKAEEDLSRAQGEIEGERTRLDDLKKERRKIEQEVQELDGKVEKSSAKLSQIKSNKEYTAALKEIDDLKKSKFITEDKIIAVMEKIDEMEQGAAQHDTRLKELQVELGKSKQQILAEMAELDKELAALDEKRQALVKEMDADLLKKYLFLQERRNGLAVSAVVTGVCQTCHMGIPPQKFNELIRGDALMTCPHCHRIMYWADDEHFQKVKAML